MSKVNRRKFGAQSLSADEAVGARDSRPPAAVATFAFACGLAAASIDDAQPLIGVIGPELHLPPVLAGLIVALTQVADRAGLLLLVPLADVVETRRLILWLMVGLGVALLLVSCARSALPFLGACFCVGLLAAAAQILVPFASHLVPEPQRGRVVGQVMAGLLGGILLSRPIASFVAGTLGWRIVFAGRPPPSSRPSSSCGGCSRRARPRPGKLPGGAALPPRTSQADPGAAASRHLPGADVCWVLPVLDRGPASVGAGRFVLPRGRRLVCIGGRGGILSAPRAPAGWLADRGHSYVGTGCAIGLVALTFALSAWAGARHVVAVLVVAALLLDGAVQACQVFSLRIIYMLAPEARGRMNGLYISLFFAAGALASGLSAAVYETLGFGVVCLLGAGCAVLALCYFATE